MWKNRSRKEKPGVKGKKVWTSDPTKETQELAATKAVSMSDLRAWPQFKIVRHTKKHEPGNKRAKWIRMRNGMNDGRYLSTHG